MKQIERFEMNANKSLKKLGAFLSKIIKFIVPNKLQDFSKRSVDKTKKKLNTLKVKANEGIKKLPSSIKDNTKKLSDVTKKISTKANKAQEKLRNFDIKKVNNKTIIAAFLAIFAPIGIKAKAWYVSLRPETFLAYIMAGMITTFGSVNIYNSSKKIAEESKPEEAVQVEQVDQANAPSRRPGYFNNVKKQFQISHVTLPVYVTSSNSVKSLIIDFKLESSNRYIREYFVKHEHLVKDKLNKTIQPIVPDFPLTLEGKVIIKDKVRKELNGLIKELKIDGEIKEVNFHHIISG